MENNKNYLSTFKFYDLKGRRLSTFARIKDQDVLEITMIPCSKKDQFSKKEGRRRFEENDSKEIVIKRITVDGNTSKKTFINYMYENYYRATLVDVQVELLVCGDKNAEIINIL